jgi:hypothetical protein
MSLLQLKSLNSYMSHQTANAFFKNPETKNSKKNILSFGKTPKTWNTYAWENQYKNLHLTYKSICLREILNHKLKKKGFNLNLFYFQKTYAHLSVIAKFFSFYTPKYIKVFKNLSIKKISKKQRYLKSILLKKNSKQLKKENSFIKNIFLRKLLKKQTRNNLQLRGKNLKTLGVDKIKYTSIKNIAQAIHSLNFSPNLNLSIWTTSLPKTYVIDNAVNAFSRFKNNIHFWSGLQSLRLVVSGKGSSQLLANYVANGVRRNRKRVAFIMYLKRLIDWHFKAIENLQIQGIRIETKGRFNAKSRCRKYILCVGRVAKSEKTSNVDYAFTEAITVFGSLGIKVWICPN